MRRAGPTSSGLGVVGLSVLIAVAAGCGQATTPSARDGGELAAPAVTASDAPSRAAPTTDAPTTTAATTTTAAPTTVAPATTAPAVSPSAPEDPLPEPPSIDTARVVVNQSNVAVNTGGASSARSVIDSAAARLEVHQGAAGLELASLDVKPGWTEAARAESPTEITLRYVLDASSVDIRIWTNGAGISSSVSASSDR